MSTARAVRPDNRRRHERVAIDDAFADVSVGAESSQRYTIDNLSEGGALLEGPIAGPVGTQVALKVYLQNLDPVDVRARIVRHESRDGSTYIAVCFVDSVVALRNAIHELVLQALTQFFPDM
jgi:hypothetical protein